MLSPAPPNRRPRRIGGGAVWGWLSYDPELDLIFYGTGNRARGIPRSHPVFSFVRDEAAIAREKDLDGFYVLRTSVPAEALEAGATVLAYKSLAHVERVFRSLKLSTSTSAPFTIGWPGRVRARVFLCGWIASRGVGSIRSSPWPLGITWIFDGREVTIIAWITANLSAAMWCRAVSIPWASSRKGSTPSRSGDRPRHVVSPVGIEGSAAHENYL